MTLKQLQEQSEKEFDEKFCQLIGKDEKGQITIKYVVKDYNEHDGDYDEYEHWTNDEIKSFLHSREEIAYKAGKAEALKEAVEIVHRADEVRQKLPKIRHN